MRTSRPSPGRGGGLTDEGFARKKDVLRRALTRRAVDKDDVLDVLCAVGGLDIAAMAGAFLGCAHERIPAAVDGFISVVAALCAVTLCPEVRDYLFLSHDSYEVGYRLAADRLGLEPCLHLGMRLGEGSGCPLLFRVLEGACGVMGRGMATFAQAAIQDDYLDRNTRRRQLYGWTSHEDTADRRRKKRKEHHGPTPGRRTVRGRTSVLLGHHDPP